MVEKIDIETLAKIEQGIRNKLLSGKNKDLDLSQLNNELNKELEVTKKRPKT